MFEDRPEDQEAPRIKVTDRRLFDRDGNPREPDMGEEPPAPLPPLTASPEPARPVAPQSGQPQPGPPQSRQPQPGQPQPGQPGAAPLQVSADALLHFLEEQYMMAMIALGAMPHPQTGQPAEDLDMAQLRIEMLDALRERTEGHRPPEATQALDEILYRLRMAYLQKRKVVKI